ncbi:MAG: cyclohydrolase, partial [Pseudonocardiales bacterium]|nr:cyclohydrolase [Pseudonocardiales bacterium]
MTVSAPVPPPPLRIVPQSDGVDLTRAERAATAFLQALGVDTDSDSTAATPRRMAHAYAEMLRPRPFDLTTFPNDEDYDELVLARGIPVHSVCEHHMLPFLG